MGHQFHSRREVCRTIWFNFGLLATLTPIRQLGPIGQIGPIGKYTYHPASADKSEGNLDFQIFEICIFGRMETVPTPSIHISRFYMFGDGGQALFFVDIL